MALEKSIQLGLTLFAAAALLGASCTTKLCESAEDCRRECECVSSATDRTTQCSMAFECNVVEGYCSDAYEQSCRDICQNYAAKDACGTRTCEREADCLREAACVLHNPQSGERLCDYTCEVAFACDVDAKVCASEYAIGDDALCGDVTLCPPPQSCAR